MQLKDIMTCRSNSGFPTRKIRSLTRAASLGSGPSEATEASDVNAGMASGSAAGDTQDDDGKDIKDDEVQEEELADEGEI